MTSWSEGALEVTHAKKKLRDRIIESCFLELSRDSIGHCHTEKSETVAPALSDLNLVRVLRGSISKHYPETFLTPYLDEAHIRLNLESREKVTVLVNENLLMLFA